MSGYIGKSQGVTQVDGYNRSEADAEFVNDPNDVITVSGGNVGVGTVSPSTLAHLKSSGDFAALTIETATTGGASYINLGDSNDQDVGQIAYYNSDDSLRVKVNASERLRIDSAGRVTMPYQPAFSAYVSNSYSSSSTASKVLYNSTWINQGSHFNTSTNTFTAPLGGKYKFNSRVSLSVSSGEYARAANVMFYVNGSLYGANYHNIRNAIPSVSGTAVYHGLEGSAIINLSANDTVSVYLNWETDGTLDASETVHYHGTYFEGYLIG